MKPIITLFICTSIDGKITGKYGDLKNSQQAVDLFKQIGFQETHPLSYHFQGWLYGTNTALEFAGEHFRPKYTKHDVPAGDYLIHQNEKKYFIAFDRKGVVGWQKNTTSYAEVEAHILVLLTNLASNEYRAHLRNLEIPYLIVGETTIDLALALYKINQHFELTNLLLGGGGYLNWSFLKAGLIDELSLLTVPAIDNEKDAATLFHATDTETIGISFQLQDIKILEGGTLWQKYKPILVEQLS